MNIRKATIADIQAVADIFDAIHSEEEAGRQQIGWERGVYPTIETARLAIAKEDLYVIEAAGKIVAAGRINQEQVDVYEGAAWEYPAEEQEVLVLHTLVVSPEAMRHHYGTRFVEFYEKLAREKGCPYLRMDTNEKNKKARSLYHKLGYKEIGIVPCVFNGIEGVQLVLLEKKVIDKPMKK